MHDKVISAQRDRAYDFIVICLDRADTHHRIGCRQIDQVIGVDDQRAEAEFGALGAKLGSVDFRDARPDARPHARAGRENLQRVAAEFLRRLSSEPAKPPAIEVWMPMRTLPSRQAGACGSGTGSGRYSSLLSKSRIEVSEAVIFQLRSLHSIESKLEPQILLQILL